MGSKRHVAPSDGEPSDGAVGVGGLVVKLR